MKDLEICIDCKQRPVRSRDRCSRCYHYLCATKKRWTPDVSRGRPKLLNNEEADKIRYLYYETSCGMSRIARHAGVSLSTIRQVIDRKGAYTQLPRYIPMSDR